MPCHPEVLAFKDEDRRAGRGRGRGQPPRSPPVSGPNGQGPRSPLPHGFLPTLIVTIAAEPVPNWQFYTGRAPQLAASRQHRVSDPRGAGLESTHSP